MKKHRILIRIISIILSVILSFLFGFSLIGLTITGVSRAYFTSDKFKTKIDNTDLATLTFYDDNEKVTLEQYVKGYVTENVEEFINDNPLSNYTNILSPFVGNVTDFVVDKALSSDFVNRIVKTEVHSIFDYLLYSDVDEAKQRIKDGITLEQNYKLDPDNAPTFEEKISAEVKIAVFKYIEEESGLSTDQIIVLLSEETITSLTVLSFLFVILLVIVALPEFPSIFVYLKFVLWGYKIVIYNLASGFKEYFAGNEDLISHQLLKPVIDSFVPYADQAFKLSMVFMVISWIIFILIFFLKRKKK